jgi:HK97 gp10 family phage protein
MQEAIQNVTSVRTGKLKNSITVSGVRTQDGVKYVAIGPSKDGWYGKFLEFGTVKMRAKPFMAPGYENGKEQATATIKEELRRGLGL